MNQPARARKVLVAACLAGIMLGACGGSRGGSPGASEEQQISQVVRSCLSAQTQGDGQTACLLLTPGAQRQLEALVVKRAKGLIPSGPSRTARIGGVNVNGDTARARVADGTASVPQTVSLAKVAGAWRIAGVPGLGG